MVGLDVNCNELKGRGGTEADWSDSDLERSNRLASRTSMEGKSILLAITTFF